MDSVGRVCTLTLPPPKVAVKGGGSAGLGVNNDISGVRGSIKDCVSSENKRYENANLMYHFKPGNQMDVQRCQLTFHRHDSKSTFYMKHFRLFFFRIQLQVNVIFENVCFCLVFLFPLNV